MVDPSAQDLRRRPGLLAARDRAEWPGGDSLVEAVADEVEARSLALALHSRMEEHLGNLEVDTQNLDMGDRHTMEADRPASVAAA